MTLQIAEAMAEFLPAPSDAAASELIVLELYRQMRISRGKAAELLWANPSPDSYSAPQTRIFPGSI